MLFNCRCLVRSPLILLAILLAGAGCRSPWVSSSVTNHSTSPVSNLEVTYPKASYGLTLLAPSQHYDYRFKLSSDGPVQLQFTDPAGKLHSSTGPVIQQSRNLRLNAEITPDLRVNWSVREGAR